MRVVSAREHHRVHTRTYEIVNSAPIADSDSDNNNSLHKAQKSPPRPIPEHEVTVTAGPALNPANAPEMDFDAAPITPIDENVTIIDETTPLTREDTPASSGTTPISSGPTPTLDDGTTPPPLPNSSPPTYAEILRSSP